MHRRRNGSIISVALFCWNNKLTAIQLCHLNVVSRLFLRVFFERIFPETNENQTDSIVVEKHVQSRVCNRSTADALPTGTAYRRVSGTHPVRTIKT